MEFLLARMFSAPRVLLLCWSCSHELVPNTSSWTGYVEFSDRRRFSERQALFRYDCFRGVAELQWGPSGLVNAPGVAIRSARVQADLSGGKRSCCSAGYFVVPGAARCCPGLASHCASAALASILAGQLISAGWMGSSTATSASRWRSRCRTCTPSSRPWRRPATCAGGRSALRRATIPL